MDARDIIQKNKNLTIYGNFVETAIKIQPRANVSTLLGYVSSGTTHLYPSYEYGQALIDGITDYQNPAKSKTATPAGQ